MRRWPSAGAGAWAGGKGDRGGCVTLAQAAAVQPVHQPVLRARLQARARAIGRCSVAPRPSPGGPPVLGVARPEQTPRRRARRLRAWWARGRRTLAALSRAAALRRRLGRRAPAMCTPTPALPRPTPLAHTSPGRFASRPQCPAPPRAAPPSGGKQRGASCEAQRPARPRLPKPAPPRHLLPQTS